MCCTGCQAAGCGLTAAQHARAHQQHVQGLEREQMLLPGPGLRHVQAAVKVSELHASGVAGMGVPRGGLEQTGWQCSSEVLKCPGNTIQFGIDDAAAKGGCRAPVEKLSLLTPCISRFVHNNVP